MRSIRTLAALAGMFLLAAGLAQTPGGRYSATTGDVALVAASTTLTIQQPTTPVRPLRFELATIYCSVACNVNQSQNGTAATATAGTLTPISPYNQAATGRVFTASNVGAGTAIGGILHLQALQMVTLDLSQVVVPTQAAANYSITVSAITGTANISVIEVER